MALTIGGLLLEARGILQDTVSLSGGSRYSDSDLIAAFNDALLQIRAKRPDAFIDMGLRNPVPQYVMPGDSSTTFPIDPQYYPPVLFYVCGRTEMRDDPYADNKRAATLMQKFVGMLTQVAS